MKIKLITVRNRLIIASCSQKLFQLFLFLCDACIAIFQTFECKCLREQAESDCRLTTGLWRLHSESHMHNDQHWVYAEVSWYCSSEAVVAFQVSNCSRCINDLSIYNKYWQSTAAYKASMIMTICELLYL